jgi:hypothetical protein
MGNRASQGQILGFADVAINIPVAQAQVSIEERAMFFTSRTLAITLAALGITPVEPADHQRPPESKEAFPEPVVPFEIAGEMALDVGCRCALHRN